MTLTSQFISDKLTAKWPVLGSTFTFMSDPPTATEEVALIMAAMMFYIMYEDDPDSIGSPDDEPRKTWDTMLGEPYEDIIAAGVVAMSP